MLELVHVYTAASATSIEHYSIEEVAVSFWCSLTTITSAKPLRCIIWAVQQMQLKSRRPETGNENSKKNANGKQSQITVPTHA